MIDPESYPDPNIINLDLTHWFCCSATGTGSETYRKSLSYFFLGLSVSILTPWDMPKTNMFSAPPATRGLMDEPASECTGIGTGVHVFCVYYSWVSPNFYSVHFLSILALFIPVMLAIGSQQPTSG
jgi:hypothetical protein